LADDEQAVEERVASPVKDKLWTRDFVQILTINCMVFISFQMLVPVLPLYVTTIGGNEASVGLVMAALTLAVLLVRPFTGWLVDRRGRRIVMIASFTTFTMATALLAHPLAASVVALITIRIAQGVGWSGVNPSVSAIVTDIIPARRLGEGLAYQSTSQSIAMAIGPASGLFVLGLAGYTPTFLTSVALGSIALVLSLWVRQSYLPRTTREGFRLRDLIEASSLAPSTITALTTFLFGGLASFVPLASMERDLGNPAAFFVTFAVGLIIIRPITGQLSDAVARRGAFLLPGLALIFSCLLVLAFTEAPWTLVTTGLLWAIGFGITQPVLRVMAVLEAPQERWGSANATMATAYEGGMGAGALLLGALASQVGIPTMFAVSSLVPLLALILVFKWRLHRE
jgi:MFS family permease